MARGVVWTSFALAACAATGGCSKEAPALAPTGPAVVIAGPPVEQEVTDYEDFTGRTEAVQSVEIRPRVNGYLVQMPFKEGDEVGLNDLLFEIDPRPYQAQFDAAKGQVDLMRAKLQLAIADNVRAKKVGETKGAISQQDLDKYAAAQAEANAALKATEANLESYRLNLEFTKVLSPIAGRVSRYYLTLGNLVNQDTTLLTTVVSQDPMYAYFNVDERTMQRVQNLIRTGKIREKNDSEIPVLMGLASETGYPHEGTIDFVNNRVDPSTGTIQVRGVFQNPKPERGERVLVPGTFIRVRVPIGDPHSALLVADRVISSDQGQKIVYVVNEKDEVVYRPVELGALHDGLRVVSSGLSPGDRVIIEGLQRVRPGMVVSPKPGEMLKPSTTDKGAGASAPSAKAP